MTKKSEKQQDDQKRDDHFIEIPEDRIDQIENTKAEGQGGEKPQRRMDAKHNQEQPQGSKDALRKVTKKSKAPREDLLADVRQSLLEEEEEVEEPKGFFARIKSRLKKTPEPKPEEVKPPAQLDVEVEPQADLREMVLKPKRKKKKSSSRNKEEEKAIQEFFSDLAALADVTLEDVPPSTPTTEEAPVEEAKVEEKVKRVPKLPVKTVAEDEIDFDAVREMALQEYDETRIEPEERKQPLQEDVRRTIRELKPFERFLLIAAGVLTVGVLLVSGIYLIVGSISIPTPAPTATIDVGNIVHPTRLSLPGGWTFDLGEGQVNNGEWTPQGAEWLVGTEISRWVALPWSLQLEAVLRTLKSGDQIELQMSNFDVLTFNVYSIQQMTMNELLSSDAKTPSLVIVLYNDKEADGTFWVVKALP
jgi:hypothetical protein